MENPDVKTGEVLVTRDGPVVTLTFNRPGARNAMTWGMYERLDQTIFTARMITAQEAHVAGFVHELVPPEQIGPRVRELALTLAARDDLIATTYSSADFREGVRAFLDKRTPNWIGR